jgi:hypothetical protein
MKASLIPSVQTLHHPDDDDLRPDERTLFDVRGLTKAELLELYDLADQDGMVPGGARTMFLCARGVRAIRNLEDPSGGTPMDFAAQGRRMLPDRAFDHLDTSVLVWLALKVMDLSNLTQAEQGKSSPPRTSTSGTATAGAPGAEPASLPSAPTSASDGAATETPQNLPGTPAAPTA